MSENTTFESFALSAPLKKAIAELGFTEPTPIQAQTLPILLGEPTDFIGLATTGTGKTAAFALPLLERLVNGVDPRRPLVQAIILCPTRELALQVTEQITKLGKHLGIKALPVYGGTGYADQLRGLRNGVSIVVGTPGRVVDHINKGSLDLTAVETVILDEADEMISMGFKDDLEAVLSAVPEGQNNIWLFSATMSPPVRKVAEKFLRDPQQVQINRTEMLSENVEQIFYATSESNKPEVLCKLIDAADDFFGIVFCQTKSLVVDLTQYLRGRGYSVDCLHGDMDQTSRERAMRAFREHRAKILVATDVACRGLDVKDISHVINYSIPRELDNYVHRIGRTARSGKSGFAFSLVTPSHRGLVTRIERVTRSKMKEGKIPTRRELGAKKIAAGLTAFQNETGFVRALEILSDDWKTALEGMDKNEIAARFLAMAKPEIFGDTREEVPEKTRAYVYDEPRPPSGVKIRFEREERPKREYAKREYGAKREFIKRDGPAPRVTRSEPVTVEAEFEPAAEPAFESANAAPRKPWASKKPYEKKTFEKKPYEKKSFDKKPWGAKKPYEAKSFDKKPWGAKKPYEANSFETKPHAKKWSKPGPFGGSAYAGKKKSGFKKAGPYKAARND